MISKNISLQMFTRLCFGILAVVLIACEQTGPPPQAPAPYKSVILDSLAHPWSMAFINDHEAFITEKEGDLLRVDLTHQLTFRIKGFPQDLFTPLVLDVSKYQPRIYPISLDGQTISGNAGILDVILHPDFDKNAQLFVSYVSAINETYALKVISATVVNDSLSDIKTILNPGPYVPGLWHFGGGLCIQDSCLYVTVGERLFFENLKIGLPIAQDTKDARGAIYRVLLDGNIPADNPELGVDAVQGMYAFGIRAAQGIIRRPGTHEIWFSEHGTNQGDEINLLQPGANYGWPNKTTGTWRSADYVPTALPNPTYTDPQHYWLQTVAPTGLSFYTGTEFPSWQGNLLVPGLSRGSLWRLVLNGPIVMSAEELFLDDHVRLRKVIQSPSGQLYILTDEDNGKLIQIKNKTHDN